MPIIVFVSERPRSREAKQSYGLRKKGWRTVLLFKFSPNYDINKYFDNSIQYSDPIEAVRIVKKLSPLVCHVHSLFSRDETSLIFMLQKPTKIVFDVNDTSDAMFNEKYQLENQIIKNQKINEKFLIENADALCCRDYQLQYTIEKNGLTPPKHRILFQEYCAKEEFITGDKLSAKTGEYHVVQVGNFDIEKQGSDDNGMLAVGELFDSVKVHLHLYVHWFNYGMGKRDYAETFSDYLELENRSKYFHIHPCVRMDDLRNNIKHYDAGLMVCQRILFGGEFKKCNYDGYLLAASGRMYDYIDAGLPVICYGKSLAYNTLNKYNIALKYSMNFFNNLKSELKKFYLSQPENRLKLALNELKVTNHTNRLIEFYNQVAAD